MRESDVREFIVIPPQASAEALHASKERFIDFLSRRFPEYIFKISPFVPIGDAEDFAILPVMNYCADDGTSRMCNPPDRWRMAEIAQACLAFDSAGNRSCAA